MAFLGTGSALPSKYRNVTGMLVRLSPTDPACPTAGAAGVVGVSDSAEAREGLCGGDGSGSGGGSGGGGGGGGAEAEGDNAAAFGGGGSILLDAGEGSMGQLWRMYGDSSSSSGGGEGDACHGRGGGGAGDKNAGVQQMLRNLSAVWISHPHADHHLGLVRILSERNKLLSGGGGGGAAGSGGAPGGVSGGEARLPKLLLMAPSPVAAWLKV